MKEVMLIDVIVAASTYAKAQINYDAQVGGNLANAKLESTESGTTVKEKTKAKFGFLIGVVAEVSITSSLSFRPELNFIQKGYKLDNAKSESGATLVYTG